MSSPLHRTPFLLRLYRQYLENQDSTGFVASVSQGYTAGTLQRLAEHRDREVRRAAILALGFAGDYAANHTMGRALLDEDRTVRALAENGIRSVWSRAGSQQQRRQLHALKRLNAARRYEQVVHRAGELLHTAPWFAEVWYQRAVAQFNLGRYAETIRDSHQTLEINPYHFPAATSMGQAYVKLQNYVSALECFRRALRLNPDLEAVRVQVVRLARMVEDQ